MNERRFILDGIRRFETCKSESDLWSIGLRDIVKATRTYCLMSEVVSLVYYYDIV